MKLKEKLAKAITQSMILIAYKAARRVSIAGTYQPKEPKVLTQIQKNKKN